LVVGAVLKCNKGIIGEAFPVTSLQDLLLKCTFSGTVAPTDDKTFHTLANILKETNLVYLSRASKNALYGGLVVKKEDILGDILEINTSKIITISGDITALVSADDTIRIKGISTALDGRYTVVSSSFDTDRTEVIVSETISDSYIYVSGIKYQALKSRQPSPLSQELIGSIINVIVGPKELVLTGDMTEYVLAGDKIEVRGSTANDKVYTVDSSTFVIADNQTTIVVLESLTDDTVDGDIFRNSIVEPSNYKFKEEDLFIVTGKDQGSYNSDISVSIVSSLESDTITEDNAVQLLIYNANKNSLLESYVFSRDMAAIATDGTNLYLEDVVSGSNNIRIINNIEVINTEIPCSTTSKVRLSGGTNGDDLVDADLVSALGVFYDKIIPISIMANGSLESPTYQKALLDLANTRQDIFAFINSRLSDEKATVNSVKANNVVAYKKEELASTSYYATMYAPHVTIPDVFNSRNIAVGADAKAIPGWLSVLRTKGYPYAFAGSQLGTLSNCTCAWKIGDQSGEAQLLNDASINFIAYDPIQGTYVATTQNTLQIAASSLRNTGVMLNVLDIKQTLATLLKQFLGLPITDNLRSEMVFTGTNYMNGIKSANRVSNFAFQDVSTDLDITQDTLRFILTICPTGYAQRIYLVLNIVNATFDFSILQKVT
jgi:uncharacterized protein YqfB (UPF0267 family)